MIRPGRWAVSLLLLGVLAGCGSTPPTPPPSAGATSPGTLSPAPSTTAQPSATPSPQASSSPSPSASSSPSPSASLPVTGIVPASLDGALVDASVGLRLPLAVSIDDSRPARPQAGFNGASIVYQAPADGYETRYLLVFQEGDASMIGPVRSARNYTGHWASEYRSALAHYGGDRISRAWIEANSPASIISVDGMGGGGAAFHRIKTRVAPHNAYTSTKDLARVARRLGGASTIDGSLHVRPFRDDSPAAERGASQAVSIPYATVRIGYTYDAATNAYLRLIDGKRHMDPGDGKQVTARTILILYMTFRTDNTIEKGHSRPVLGYIGSGKGVAISEGRATKIAWSKASGTAPTIVTDPTGAELSMVRGRIFIQAVPIGTKVSIK